MLCLDTSSVIAYLQGDLGTDVTVIEEALTDQVGVLAPVTVAELLSDPWLRPDVRRTLLELPALPVLDGYWERAGLLRAKLLRHGAKAKLADTLIAQSCLDHRATLITRDRDFRALARFGGLRILGVPMRET
jgi:predicted nucleic acid-binding protein